VNNRSLQTLGRFSVDGQGMKSRPLKPPVANCGLLCTFKPQSCPRQRARAESEPCHRPGHWHTPHLCDDKAPDHAWLHSTSKFTLGIGLANPSPQGWWCARTCARQGTFSHCQAAAMEMDSGHHGPNQDTPDLPRWVHEGRYVGCVVGATSHT
jgi:hypothetical protein